MWLQLEDLLQAEVLCFDGFVVCCLLGDCLLVGWLSVVNDAVATDVSLPSEVEVVEGDDSLQRDVDASFFLGLSYCSLGVSLMHLDASTGNPPLVIALQHAEVFAVLVAADDERVSGDWKQVFQGWHISYLALSFGDFFAAWEVVARHQGVGLPVRSDALLKARSAGLFDVLDCHVVLELPSFLP